MISVIIQFLIAKFTTLPYISKCFGLASYVEVGGERVVAVYENSELVQLNFDAYKALTYIVTNGNSTRGTVEHPYIANLEKVTEVYPFRVIIYSQGKENVNCSSQSQSIAQGIKKSISGLQDELVDAVNADTAIVRITDCDYNKNTVWASQTSLPNTLKDDDILVSVDFEVTITGDEQCFAGEPCVASEFVFSNAAVSFCQMVNDCIGSSEPYSLESQGNGTGTITMSELVGKEVLLVSTDGRIRTDSDYTFVSATGATTFISTVYSDQTIYWLYK